MHLGAPTNVQSTGLFTARPRSIGPVTQFREVCEKSHCHRLKWRKMRPIAAILQWGRCGMFGVRGGLKIAVLGLAVIGSHVSTAVAQSSVESRLEAIETQLNRLESKLDRVLAGQQMSVLGVGEEIIRQQACDGSMLDKQFFVICHMADWKIARWVGYHLTADKLQGTAKRTDNFRPDSQLPHDERSELSDYSGSGYDRGHMAPAAAFKRSKKAMSTTFFLSNMAPQTPQLNRRIWRILEEEVRTLAKEHGEVWVFTGNLFLDDTLHPAQPVVVGRSGPCGTTPNCER